ncbi:MAG: hypothetical protein GX846_08220 [Deltaproteobacteria bacterium]|nr:hypothetical protein [Deltaproteobacteria bacterium]
MYVDVICSWCNKVLRTKSMGRSRGRKTGVATHTICSSCKQEVIREYKKSLKQTRPGQRQGL